MEWYNKNEVAELKENAKLYRTLYTRELEQNIEEIDRITKQNEELKQWQVAHLQKGLDNDQVLKQNKALRKDNKMLEQQLKMLEQQLTAIKELLECK